MPGTLPPTSVVIPAAGEGVRLPGPVRKPWRSLAGKPVLIRTLEAFRGLGFIKEVVLLVHPDDLADVKRRWSKALTALKVSCVLPGGATRTDSVAKGVLATSETSRLVLIHDAARPLVTGAEVRAVAQAAWRGGAAILAIPATDTVKRVDSKGIIVNTLPRKELWLAQTPQGFKRALILKACRRWSSKPSHLRKTPTDDAGLMETLFPVRVVAGSGGNFKLSTPADLRKARILWNSRPGNGV